MLPQSLPFQEPGHAAGERLQPECAIRITRLHCERTEPGVRARRSVGSAFVSVCEQRQSVRIPEQRR